MSAVPAERINPALRTNGIAETGKPTVLNCTISG
jgi:hypothetical protein